MNRRQRGAERLWFGSGALARRLAGRAADWVRKGPTRTHRVVRIVLVILGLYVAARIVRAAPNLMWAVTGWWCWCATRAGWTTEETAEGATPEPNTPDLEDVREAWNGFISVASEGRQGVHLRDLLVVLHRGGHHPDWEVTDVRAMCEALGIPVRQRVRVRGKGVTVGIHRDDLRPPSTPSPGVAPQEAQKPQLHPL